MSPQFKKINDESGMVLFIVLMTAIIIMIFSAGVLTQSMNELNYGQQQIDQITCDQLTKGGLWENYANGMTGFTVGVPVTVTVPIPNSGRTYNLTITDNGPDVTGATRYAVSCSYDTFQ